MKTPVIQCQSCSAEIAAESRFCPSCGQPLVPLSEMPTSAGAAAAAPRASRISSGSILTGGFTPGVILGDRYRIIGLLGRGGMGEVYRADDLKLGQPVALKFLAPGFEKNADRLRRFLDEVRTARQVSHTNVCRIYDAAEAEGHHFLSMEYVDGE